MTTKINKNQIILNLENLIDVTLTSIDSDDILKWNGTNWINNTLAEADITFTDITTNNASTSKHGYLPKLGGGTSNFLRADGTWATPSSGISEVKNDTTPQLGGSLDVNGNKIVSASDGNVEVEPNGTGKIVLNGPVDMSTDGDGFDFNKNTPYFTVQTLATSSTVTIDWRKGTYAYLDISGNVTGWTKTDPSGDCTCRIIIDQDSTARTITWWSGIKWYDPSDKTWNSTNSAPDISTVSETYIVVLLYRGGTWYGAY